MKLIGSEFCSRADGTHVLQYGRLGSACDECHETHPHVVMLDYDNSYLCVNCIRKALALITGKA